MLVSRYSYLCGISLAFFLSNVIDRNTYIQNNFKHIDYITIIIQTSTNMYVVGMCPLETQLGCELHCSSGLLQLRHSAKCIQNLAK